jgi:hypothetical protein
MFKCLITRETEYDNNEVFRTFDEFCELYQLLTKTFPTLRLSDTLPLSKFKDIKSGGMRRFQAIEQLVKDIMSLQAEISHVFY